MPCRQTGAGIFHIFKDGQAVDVPASGVFLLSRLGMDFNHTHKHIAFFFRRSRPAASPHGLGQRQAGRESLFVAGFKEKDFAADRLLELGGESQRRVMPLLFKGAGKKKTPVATAT